MATVISSGAPYYIPVIPQKSTNLSTGQYRIYSGTSASQRNLLYVGKVYSAEENNTPVRVNITPILSQYSPDLAKFFAIGSQVTTEEELIFDNDIRTSTDFFVEYSQSNGTYTTLDIEMIYCRERQTTSELRMTDPHEVFYPSELIENRWLRNSPFSVTAITYGKDVSDDFNFDIAYKDKSGNIIHRQNNTPTKQSSTTVGILVDYANATHIRIESDGSPARLTPQIYLEREAQWIKIEDCVRSNTKVLYYLNKWGGLDWLICDGYNSVTYNYERKFTTQNTNFDSPGKFETFQYGSEMSTVWTLNTGNISDKSSKLMNNLFSSPYIWMYSPDTQEFDACIIEDTSFRIKNFNNDKVYNYTINVRLSQTVSDLH